MWQNGSPVKNLSENKMYIYLKTKLIYLESPSELIANC